MARRFHPLTQLRTTALIFSLLFGFTGISQIARADTTGCGPFDPDCSKRILALIHGITVGKVEVSAGGGNAHQPYIQYRQTLVSADTFAGDLEGAVFETAWLPDAGGYRVRITTAHSDRAFFCHDPDTRQLTRFPFAGAFFECAEEPFAIGGTIMRVQYDSDTSRIAADWAGGELLFSPLANGNTSDFLKKQLLFRLGGNVQTIWSGSSVLGSGAGMEQRKSLVRLNVGVIGMIRSKDNRWEIQGMAGYRPNVSDFSDWAFESKAEFLYHWLSKDKKSTRSVGLQVGYSHWSQPWESLGGTSVTDLVSDREPDTFRIGLVFGLPGKLYQSRK